MCSPCVYFDGAGPEPLRRASRVQDAGRTKLVGQRCDEPLSNSAFRLYEYFMQAQIPLVIRGPRQHSAQARRGATPGRDGAQSRACIWAPTTTWRSLSRPTNSDAGLLAGSRGKEHEWNASHRGISAQPGQQAQAVQAVQARHHDVRHDQVGSAAPDRFQCFESVFDRFDFSHRVKQSHQVSAHVRVVFGNQDTPAVGRGKKRPEGVRRLKAVSRFLGALLGAA